MMTPVTERNDYGSAVVPQMAIMFCGNDYSLTSITKHEIRNGQMQVGQSLDVETLAGFLHEVMAARAAICGSYKKTMTILPENVLVDSLDHLVWYQPSRVGIGWFTVRGDQRMPIKIRWPAMVFDVSKSRGKSSKLRCVALDNDQRPTANSKVYNLPMPNAYHRGGFCLGTATLPVACGIDDIPKIEECVYDAVKTHSNNSQAIKTGEDPTSYWMRRSTIAKGKAATILKRDLYPLGTLERWLAE